MSAKPTYDLKHPSGALEEAARRKFAKVIIETDLIVQIFVNENLHQILKSIFCQWRFFAGLPCVSKIVDFLMVFSDFRPKFNNNTFNRNLFLL